MKRALLIAIPALLLVFGFTQAFEIINEFRNPAGPAIKWPPAKRPVRYLAHQNGTPDVAGTTEFGQIQASLLVWNPHSPFKFTYGGKSTTIQAFNGVNEIAFDGANFDGDDSVLAYCETVINTLAVNERFEGDVHFNDRDYKWTTGISDTSVDRYKIKPTLVHEVGHSVGLGHTAIFDGTMFFADQGDDRGETLHPDDIMGIKFVYGGPFNTLAVPRLLTPLTASSHLLIIRGQAAQGITFRWAQNTTRNLRNFFVEFAGDANFTKMKKRYPAGIAEAMYIGPGLRLNALKTINTTFGQVFWRVVATNASNVVVRSTPNTFKITSIN